MRLFGYYSALSGLLGVNVTADRRGGAADSSISSAAGAPTLCSVGALGGRAHSDGEFLVLRSLVTRAQVRPVCNPETTDWRVLACVFFFGGTTGRSAFRHHALLTHAFAASAQCRRRQALALAIVRLSKAPLPVPLPSPSKNPPTRVVGGAGGGTNEL